MDRIPAGAPHNIPCWLLKVFGKEKMEKGLNTRHRHAAETSVQFSFRRLYRDKTLQPKISFYGHAQVDRNTSPIRKQHTLAQGSSRPPFHPLHPSLPQLPGNTWHPWES